MSQTCILAITAQYAARVLHFSASSFSKLMRQFVHIPALTSPIDTHSKSYLEIHLHNKKLAIHGGNACIFFPFLQNTSLAFLLCQCVPEEMYSCSTVSFFFSFHTTFFCPNMQPHPILGKFNASKVLHSGVSTF